MGEEPQSHFQMYMYVRILDFPALQTVYFQDTSNIWDRIQGDQQPELIQSGQAKVVLCDVGIPRCAHLSED